MTRPEDDATAPDDDATEIVSRAEQTAAGPEDVTVAVAAGTAPAATATEAEAVPVRKRWWLWPVAGAVVLALALFYFYQRPSPGERAQADPVAAYRSALQLAQAAVAADQVDQLPGRLLPLVRAHRQHADLQALNADASRYLDLLQLQHSGRVLALAEGRGTAPFQTDLFEQAARRTLDAALPSPAVLKQLLEADQAWQSGDLVGAITLVRQLAKDSGSALASARLAHYSRVVQDYENLATAVGTEQHTPLLLGFYLGLNPRQDRFFWQRLDLDFGSQERPTVADAADQLKEAGRLWGSYHSSGGIDSGMRQQAAASRPFRQRAGELSGADHLLGKVVALWQRLTAQRDVPAPLFQRLVKAEIDLQRARLEGLRGALEEPVLTGRLQLLR